MNTLLFALFACGEKNEDTGFFDSVEDTDTEDTDTEDTSDTSDTETDNPDSTGLELVGTYTDNWLGSHTITEEIWDTGPGYVFNISQYDNSAGYLLAQNDENNDPQYGNPGKWSKFQWTLNENGGLYYCQSIYDAATEEDAMGANGNPADLSAGCSGFSWTELRGNMNLHGDYVDNYGTPHSINPFTWVMGTEPSVFHISEYSNDDGYALAQNDENNEWSPGLYSKFEWTTDTDGTWFYCQSAYNAETLEDAKNTSSDSSNLETGCGEMGAAWSALNATGAQ